MCTRPPLALAGVSLYKRFDQSGHEADFPPGSPNNYLAEYKAPQGCLIG